MPTLRLDEDEIARSEALGDTVLVGIITDSVEYQDEGEAAQTPPAPPRRRPVLDVAGDLGDQA